MQHHQSILAFKNGRYLKWAVAVGAAAIGAYWWHDPPLVYLKPYGGTALGYTLGTLGALLILWLMLLGVRKRRYRIAIGSLQGWTSAHVYLGSALLIIVTLHSAFEFGWNIHTLAYALMVAVIASGFFGVFAYLRYPELMTRNLGSETVEAIMLEIDDLDRKCRRMALDLPDDFNAAIIRATRAKPGENRTGPGFSTQTTQLVPDDAIVAACDKLKALGKTLVGDQARLNERLLTEMARKRALSERIRRHLDYRLLLETWLFFHVPLSFALLAALIAHVVSVFYFW